MRRRLRLTVAAGAVVLAATGCGGGVGIVGEDAAGKSPAVANAEDYPPTDLAVLADELSVVLGDHGVELTRGPLIDRSDGYEPSPTGTHLALYVQPPEDHTPEAYIRNLRDLTVDTAALVFARWPALESFDICQEPPQSLDDSAEPGAWTQVDVSRDAWEAMPSDIDLAGLLVRSWDETSGVTMIAKQHLQDHPMLATAVDEAKRRQAPGGADA